MRSKYCWTTVIQSMVLSAWVISGHKRADLAEPVKLGQFKKRLRTRVQGFAMPSLMNLFSAGRN
jgi:hypothetical protein